MKKLTAFVLSAMMVLSLAACGAKTEGAKAAARAYEKVLRSITTKDFVYPE